MRDKVLIADNVAKNRNILKGILEDSYIIIEAVSGDHTVEIIKDRGDVFSVIIIGVDMIDLNGSCILDVMYKQGWVNKIPVLIVTDENDSETLRKCFGLGVMDYISKPFNAMIVRHRVKTVIELFKNKKTSEYLINKQTKELQIKNKRLNKTNENIIELLGNVVEARNLESGEHVRRVKGFTKIIAEKVMHHYTQYRLTGKKIELIVSASAMHDIGKIMIPDKILLKPGKLTSDEYNYMKTHTTKGSELLEGARDIWGDEYANICKDIVLYHHERFDGKGYPYGLVGDEIPIAAQIVSIADVYDALVTERVYKKPIPSDKAYQMIINGECGGFSDIMIDCFKKGKNEMEYLLR